MTYSKSLRTPDFTNVTELKAEIAKLPKAVGAPVLSPRDQLQHVRAIEALQDKEYNPTDQQLAEAFRNLVTVPGRKNVHVEGNPAQSYYVPSDKYRITQHEDAFGNSVVAALEKSNTPFSGTVVRGISNSGRGIPGSSVSIAVWFEDPKLTVSTGRAGETIRIGMMFENSMDGSRSLTVRTIGLNLLCKNGMISQNRDIAEVRRRHVGSEESVLVQSIQVEQFIETSVTWAERIVNQLRAASTKIIATEDVVDILWAVGVPKTHIDKLVPLDPHLTGVQKGDANSLRGVYDAVTSFYSNRYDGSTERAEDMLRNAESLLTMEVQELLDIGQTRRLKDEQKETDGTDVDELTVVQANARAISALEKSRKEN